MGIVPTHSDKSDTKNLEPKTNLGDEINCEDLIKLDQSKHEDETNDDDEVYPCDSCDHVFNEIEDLIDHYGEIAHNI